MGKVQVWDQNIKTIETINISCTKALSQTLNGAAAVTADGGAATTIAITTHGYLAGSYIYISGSVAYNGLHLITAVATSTITIAYPFVAETFAGTEVSRFVYPCPVACEIAELRFHTNSAAHTAENLVITCDATRGAGYDTVVFTKAMTGITDYVWVPENEMTFNVDDLLVVTYTNTDTHTLGIELKIRRIAKPGVVRS
jgi:hypothetical protein